jgi:hypothetical protein
MDTFTAALDILTGRGFPNALEIANEIHAQSIPKVKPKRTLEEDCERILSIVTRYINTYPLMKGRHLHDAVDNEKLIYYAPVTLQAIRGKARIRELVDARQIVHYFLDKDYGCNSVGKYTCRDHSTVLHSKKAVSDRIDTDRKFKAMIEEIGRAYGN